MNDILRPCATSACPRLCVPSADYCCASCHGAHGLTHTSGCRAVTGALAEKAGYVVNYVQSRPVYRALRSAVS